MIQLALDFLAPPSATPSAPTTAAPPSPAVQPPHALPSPVAPKPDAAMAPSSPATPPPGRRRVHVPMPPTVHGQVVSYTHPRANREFRWGESHIAYEFRRAKRRTLGMVVRPEGLVVSAPKWTPLYEVDAFLRERGDWVVRKLQEVKVQQGQLEATRIEWRDGAVLPYLGESLQVVLDPTHAFQGPGAALLDDNPTASEAPSPRVLRVGLPHSATPEQIRDATQAWLMRQAKALFTERLDHYAAPLGVRWRRLSLSNAGTRWGSARVDGSIRLNWRLIHFRLPVIDYVVAHELSHLREMNHSAAFWDTVATVMPDYAHRRVQLKSQPVPRW